MRYRRQKCARWFWQRAGVIGLSAALLGGCQIERGESSIPDQRVADAADLDAEEMDGAEGFDDAGLGAGPGAGTMSGTWLLYHERSSCVITQEQLTHAVYLVDITQEGAILSEKRRLCDTRLSEVLGMQIRIPQVVLDAIDFVDVDHGMVSGLRRGDSYTSSTEVGLWGLDLENPMTDPIPTSAEDPQVVDTDEDGNPAVTLMVGSDCARFQAQRQIITYHGTLTTPNQIDGQSAGVTDLVVYGGSDGFCTIAPPVESNDPHSRFRMVRIDGKGGAVNADLNGDGEISCEEAERLVPMVLEEREPDSSNCDKK